MAALVVVETTRRELVSKSVEGEIGAINILPPRDGRGVGRSIFVAKSKGPLVAEYPAPRLNRTPNIAARQFCETLRTVM